GLVHRDVKPSNILRGDDGRVRVVDFGLAGAQEGMDGETPDGADVSGEERLTAAEALLGTPRYMAPEQHLGPAGSPAADQYSLCAALYEGLYGTPPFRAQAPTPAEVRAQLLAQKHAGLPEPPPGSDVPAWVRAALVRGLAVEPGDRYPSLPALVAAL